MGQFGTPIVAKGGALMRADLHISGHGYSQEVKNENI